MFMDYFFSSPLQQRCFTTFSMLLMAVMTISSSISLVNASSLIQRTGSYTPVYQNLQARNLSTFFDSIPIQCQVQCDVVVGAAHTCQYLGCVCTTDHAYDLQTCVNCVVALTPYVDGIVDQYQAILDEWVNSYCAEFPTPALHVTRPGAQTSVTPSPMPTTTNSSLRLSTSSMSMAFLYSVLLFPLIASLLVL